jgi:hypothetical protein
MIYKKLDQNVYKIRIGSGYYEAASGRIEFAVYEVPNTQVMVFEIKGEEYIVPLSGIAKEIMDRENAIVESAPDTGRRQDGDADSASINP